MKFLFILAWLIPVWWIVALLGCYAMNEEVKTKLLRQRYYVPVYLTAGMILSVAYIIYYLTT